MQRPGESQTIGPTVLKVQELATQRELRMEYQRELQREFQREHKELQRE
jgi:hypothetical protein